MLIVVLLSLFQFFCLSWSICPYPRLNASCGFAPNLVCGSDGIQYLNPCHAIYTGCVETFSLGQCDDISICQFVRDTDVGLHVSSGWHCDSTNKPLSPVCSWPGIVCHIHNSGSFSYSYLIALDLSNLGINGILKSSLELLSQIEFLDLSGNELKGELPIMLPRTLQYLNLANNRFNGSIPVESGWILHPRLIHLDLSRNSLRGAIPANFGYFEALRYLNLSSNYFAGDIPSDLCLLKNFQWFDASKNPQLQCFPSCLLDKPEDHFAKQDWNEDDQLQGEYSSKRQWNASNLLDSWRDVYSYTDDYYSESFWFAIDFELPLCPKSSFPPN